MIPALVWHVGERKADHVCLRTWVLRLVRSVSSGSSRSLGGRLSTTLFEQILRVLSLTVHSENRVSGLLSLGISLANWMKETVQTALFDISRLSVESGLQKRIIESLHSSNGHLWTRVKDLEKANNALEKANKALEKANKALEEHNKALEAAGMQLAGRVELVEKAIVSTRPTFRTSTPETC